MGKKPIIAIANSFDEFLPGHVHLNKVGRIVSEAIKEAGGIPREFNTMAVDDGIAMGHTGMLYSLPSRDIIADTVEYQCNAHCADALICIPNCDKVVPGMLMAALRLNIPTVFVSGGPMEAGTTILADGTKKSTDLIDVMYATADDSVSDEELLNYEKTVCPTCGSCAGMFTANGELDRAGKLHTNVHSIDYPTLEAKLADWDIMRPTCTEEAQQMYKAAPGHIISPEPWTHTTLFDSLDRDRTNGAIHDIDHPEIHEGGLAVLRGNLAPDGCVVKTAGVPQEIWKFRGPALVVDSQEQAIEVILDDTLKPGMALVIRYEGPKGGPGMQEMLYPTSFVKGKGIGKQVAMLTDGRYSGGSSGLAIGHMAPEAANKGPVALIKNGDIIDIDIEARSVNVELTDEQLAERRRELEAGDGYVAHRDRKVSQALKAYAAFARSADKGATRDPELINKLSGLA